MTRVLRCLGATLCHSANAARVMPDNRRRWYPFTLTVRYAAQGLSQIRHGFLSPIPDKSQKSDAYPTPAGNRGEKFNLQ